MDNTLAQIICMTHEAFREVILCSANMATSPPDPDLFVKLHSYMLLRKMLYFSSDSDDLITTESKGKWHISFSPPQKTV